MNSRPTTLVTAVVMAASTFLAVPTATASPVAAATDTRQGLGAVPAEGAFVASVDFATLQTQDVRGNKCEFTVDGVLSFSGTIEGEATGVTTAVIFATCQEVLASPPGTYFDVFRFEGDFAGEVLGEPVTGELSYAGVTRVGGQVDATVILDGDEARAVARTDGQVAVGGTYRGVAKPTTTAPGPARWSGGPRSSGG